jgi:hypothetical protein
MLGMKIGIKLDKRVYCLRVILAWLLPVLIPVLIPGAGLCTRPTLENKPTLENLGSCEAEVSFSNEIVVTYLLED